jgi:hypothetical protein
MVPRSVPQHHRAAGSFGGSIAARQEMLDGGAQDYIVAHAEVIPAAGQRDI